MKIHTIPFKDTGYFSNLICDYIDKKPYLDGFYGNFPERYSAYKNGIFRIGNLICHLLFQFAASIKVPDDYLCVQQKTSFH